MITCRSSRFFTKLRDYFKEYLVYFQNYNVDFPEAYWWLMRNCWALSAIFFLFIENTFTCHWKIDKHFCLLQEFLPNCEWMDSKRLIWPSARKKKKNRILTQQKEIIEITCIRIYHNTIMKDVCLSVCGLGEVL